MSKYSDTLKDFTQVYRIDIYYGSKLMVSVKTPMEAARYVKDNTHCKASYSSVCSNVCKMLQKTQYTTRGYTLERVSTYVRADQEGIPSANKGLTDGIDPVDALLDKIFGHKEDYKEVWEQDLPEESNVPQVVRLC